MSKENNLFLVETGALIIFIIYGIVLTFIFFYAIAQLNLAYLYLKRKPENGNPTDPDFQPKVTVQLPVYNELYVVDRLIDTIASFNYPKEKLEIQVLDDSTDETTAIIDQKVMEYRDKNFDIKVIRRTDRKDFKAGALQNGLEKAKGDFIAIFDADFLPSKDFLIKTLPYFLNNQIGMVQTRWEHLNRNYSLLTRIQAFGLDAHFSVEQTGRNSGGHFINFNGTAGIWRKSTIIDSGGWSADTLTEDLDLSYRAQLKGWKFKFLEDLGSPAELPAEMNSIKSQQFRWSKGAAETARKHFRSVLKSQRSFSTKVHAFFHLFNSSIFICILICSVLSVPGLIFKNMYLYPVLFKVASVFLLTLLIIGVIYFISFRKQCKTTREAVFKFIYMFPMFLSLSMGLSLHNAWAVIQGFLGIKTSFIRTPKFNILSGKDNWLGKKYTSRKVNTFSAIEGLLAFYFLFGLGLAFKYDDFGLVPFHLMLAFGFGSIFLYTLYHTIFVNKVVAK